MSLAEIEAFERERRHRCQRTRRTVFWALMGAALVLLALGGLSLWSASTGRSADHTAVADLVVERQIEADEAEEDFHSSWTEVVERSSEVDAERLKTDGETMHALLHDAVVTGNDTSQILVEASDDRTSELFNDLDQEGVPGLDRTASQTQLGPFEPVLVDVDQHTHSYFVFVEIYDADDVSGDVDSEQTGHTSATTALAVEWSTNAEDAITEIDAHWTQDSPEHS